jgi:spore germination protein KA
MRRKPRNLTPVTPKHIVASSTVADRSDDNRDSIPSEIGEVHEALCQTWSHCDDIQYRWFDTSKGQMLIVWLLPLVGKDIAQIGVIEPLISVASHIESIRDITKHVLVPSLTPVLTWSSANRVITEGCMLIFLDGEGEALGVDVNAFQSRDFSKSELEPGVMGPQTAFVESLDKNIGLIRTILKTPQLKIENMTIGRVSGTRVAITYLNDIVDLKLVEEIRQRLQKVRMDGVLDLNMIREMTTDAPFSPFPTEQMTERPDRVAGALLQARVAILCDGTPHAMMVPATFINNIQSHEDYYVNYMSIALVRALRHVMYWTSLLLVPFYVAVVSYHQEMVPTRLMITLAATHEGIPFPSSLEAFLMVIIFESLREAGIRLPKAVGQSVSIVGALVLGQAAVAAGLVSSVMVIIVALSGVASFTIPAYALSYTNRVLQFVFIILAAVFGILGLTVGLFALFIHLVSLRSYGVPYMSPLGPMEWKSLLRDTLTRAPWWNMSERPEMMHPKNLVRERTSRPRPDGGNHP